MINVQERDIRNVDLKESFSFLEVPAQFGDALLQVQGARINDKNVRFELTHSGSQGGGGGFRGNRGGDRGNDRGGERSGDRFGGERFERGDRDSRPQYRDRKPSFRSEKNAETKRPFRS